MTVHINAPVGIVETLRSTMASAFGPQPPVLSPSSIRKEIALTSHDPADASPKRPANAIPGPGFEEDCSSTSVWGGSPPAPLFPSDDRSRADPRSTKISSQHVKTRGRHPDFPNHSAPVHPAANMKPGRGPCVDSPQEFWMRTMYLIPSRLKQGIRDRRGGKWQMSGVNGRTCSAVFLRSSATCS